MAPFDVAIVGAGPAGAVAALNLAAFCRVLLVDRIAVPQPRIGESLPGAARHLLADMGLWHGFVADGHAPCHAVSSVWGGGDVETRDFLADPDGHGWHLDRARFDARLRAAAAARGATVLAPASVARVEKTDDGWRLGIADARTVRQVDARLLVDAGGRLSRLLQPFGATRIASDRLVCGWLRWEQGGLSPGLTRIEAEADGWWYAAGLPQGGGVVAFHTDRDLAAARSAHRARALLARARTLPMLGGQLDQATLDGAAFGFCAAHSARLPRAAGTGWLAVGDAALAFDPLASQGLFNALYTGLAGALAAERCLAGESGALDDYAEALVPVAQIYAAHLAAWYGVERRWPDSAFWRRRG